MYDLRTNSDKLVEEMLSSTMGLSSGIKALDDYLLGFNPGEYIIVAGRPGMGKSSLARDIALSIGRENTVVFFTLEMTEKEVPELLLANLAQINYYNVVRGEVMDSTKSLLDKARTSLSAYNIIIDGNSCCTPKRMSLVLSEVSKQEKVSCVIVDYIQLMSIGSPHNRQEQVSQISRELLALSKEFDVPIIALSQLNRQLEFRESTRPRLSDLRESGSLEQDAHKVLLLHRPSYYDIKLDPSAEDSGEAEIIIAKNRKGPTGVIKCGFIKEWMSFMDIPEANDEF